MQDYEKLGLFYLGREYAPSTKSLTDELVLYDAKDLTTHAVCVGMTGSGKTGLCVSLLEEAAIDGIPALVIDPKGDIGNLLLTFPELRAADFAPWVDPADAQRKGVTPEQLAEKTAATWQKGLAEWGQDGARITKLRESADIAIYTPGSDTGLPLSILKSFDPPAGELDAASQREAIGAVVSGLLALVGIEADPIQSREHILLSSILDHSWRAGRSLDLAALINAIQKPPFDKVGVFDVETFYPAKDRLGLAMQVNNLLASPGFHAWLEGEALDVQRLLFTPEGKPRIAIISIAHLNDAERMFVVTLVLNVLLAWMRQQSGTSSLRALFYMDEIFGYFPPSAMPPSKKPMLTLLKQARAFGVGMVVATQNPVDLDYKGLSNCGTWFIGRLQTQRDKDRVIEGLESALSGASNWSKAELDSMMSNLESRVFLMRNVHDDAPVLMKTRWALSYLKGPLSQPEIERLMAERKAALGAASARSASATPGGLSPLGTGPSSAIAHSVASTDRPMLPDGIGEVFLPANAAGAARSGGTPALTYRPGLVATAKLHYLETKSGIDAWVTRTLLAPFSDDGKDVLWGEAVDLAVDGAGRLVAAPAGGGGSTTFDRLADTVPADGASFAEVPASALRAASYKGWGNALEAHLFETGALETLRCDAMKLAAAPGESEGEFRARLSLALREKRDAEVDKLREKHARKLQTLIDQIRRAEDKVAREASQYSQRKLDTAVSIGAGILGAIFGGKRGSVGRIGTAAKTVGRAGSEKADVARAEESLEVLVQRKAELEQQIEREVAALSESLDGATKELQRVRVPPRKSDIAIGRVAIAWTPWTTGADGFPAAAWKA